MTVEQADSTSVRRRGKLGDLAVVASDLAKS
jgi:hypothetical protein